MDTLEEVSQVCRSKSSGDFQKEFPIAFLVEVSRAKVQARIAMTVYDERDTARAPTSPKADPGAKISRIVRKATGGLAPAEMFFIGRSPECDLAIPLNSVSKSHAYLTLDTPGGPYFVCDQRSTNGTFLNGRRIMVPKQKTPLKDGNVISLGQEAHFLFFSAAGLHAYCLTV